MRFWLVTAVSATLLARSAAASPDPWEEGVSKVDQQRATALFMDGNRLYAQEALPPAIEKYRAALAIWDHPLIHFNLAVALYRLDRFVDAADELERAKKFGEAPFTDQILRAMTDYDTKLKAKVGELEATCTNRGATVVLDGKDWFACPATQRVRVVAGDHMVVAGSGAARVSVGGGAHVSTTIREGSLNRTQLRWRPWIPWTIVGVGAAVAGTGIAIAFSAKASYDDAKQCLAGGCDITPQQATDRMNHEAHVAHLATYPSLLGFAAITTGVVMLLVNHKSTNVPTIEVVPTSGGGTATAGWTF